MAKLPRTEFDDLLEQMVAEGKSEQEILEELFNPKRVARDLVEDYNKYGSKRSGYATVREPDLIRELKKIRVAEEPPVETPPVEAPVVEKPPVQPPEFKPQGSTIDKSKTAIPEKIELETPAEEAAAVEGMGAEAEAAADAVSGGAKVAGRLSKYVNPAVLDMLRKGGSMAKGAVGMAKPLVKYAPLVGGVMEGADALKEMQKDKPSTTNIYGKEIPNYLLHGGAGLSMLSAHPAIMAAGGILGVEASHPEYSQYIADKMYDALPDFVKPKFDKPSAAAIKQGFNQEEALREVRDDMEHPLEAQLNKRLKRTDQQIPDSAEDGSSQDEEIEQSDDQARSVEQVINKSMKQDEEPEATPTPSPTPSGSAQRSPSSFGNKLMDVLGMPSAYAEERPLTAPVPGSTPSATPTPSPTPSPTPEATATPSPTPTPTPVPKPVQKVAGEKKPVSWKKLTANDMKDLTIARSLRFGFPPELALAFIDQETGGTFSPKQGIGDKNASGMTQVTSPTFEGVKRAFPDELKNTKHSDLRNPNNYVKAIDAGILTLKMKVNELKAKYPNFDLSNPEHRKLLANSYFGFGKSDSQGTTPQSYKDSVYNKSLKYGSILAKSGVYDKKNPKFPDWGLADSYGNKEKLAVPMSATPEPHPTPSGEQPQSSVPSDASSDLADTDTSGESDESSSKIDATALIKALQDQGSSDREMKLAMMKNLLNGQSMTGIAKGLALASSGLMSANKKFVTVPELKGMENFADLERGPASALAMQDMVAKGRYDDPTSPESEAYRNYASNVLKKLDPKFDVNTLQGLSANSIKTLLPMGMKEEDIFTKRLKEITGQGERGKKLDLAFNAKEIKPAREKLAGFSGGVGKDLLARKVNADLLLTSTLGLPRDLTLDEFEKSKDKYIKQYNEYSSKQAADVTQALNAFVSGKGAPTQAMFKELDPRTWERLKSEIDAWASGGPKPAQLGEYLALFTEMAMRGRSVLEQNRRELMGGMVRPIGQALKQNPEFKTSSAAYRQLLEENELDDVEDHDNIMTLLREDPKYKGDYMLARKAYNKWKESKNKQIP